MGLSLFSRIGKSNGTRPNPTKTGPRHETCNLKIEHLFIDYMNNVLILISAITDKADMYVEKAQTQSDLYD